MEDIQKTVCSQKVTVFYTHTQNENAKKLNIVDGIILTFIYNLSI